MKYTPEDLEIFILSYNRPQFLEETLTSICKQTVNGFRIAVLDNGSTENIPAVISKFSEYGIELIGSEQNYGNVYNFERAKRLASRKWVMAFHDDDLMHPGYIETILKFVNKYDDLVIISSSMDREENPSNDKWTDLTTNAIYFKDYADLTAYFHTGITFSFPAVLYRTDIFKETHLRYDLYGKTSDVPFKLDVARNGSAIALIDKYIQYRIHSGQDCRTGPTEDQFLGVMQKYHEIIGSSLLNPNGRVFIAYNYGLLKMGYNWTAQNQSKADFERYIKKAIEIGAATRLSVSYGKYHTNKIIRGTMRKITKLLINKKFQYIS